MAQRMPRIIVSLPEIMLKRFREVVANDGRSQGEIVRAMIGEMIQARSVQSAVIRSFPPTPKAAK